MATIRLLREADLDDCMRLKEAAGWNQTAADWRALLRVSPDGCFGLELDSRIVATTTSVVHNGVGWIGMVLTDPAHRGRGFARALMEHALAWTDPQTPTVKLDATHLGEPLYRKLGFVDECVIERWTGEYSGAPAACAGDYAGQLRHPAIPLDAVAQTPEAWAAGRPGSNAWYFGPCYAAAPEAAEQVARALLAGRGRAAWDLFPDHPAAAIAARLGFAPARRLLRMVRGTPAPTPPDVYAIAGFEWG